MLYPNQFIINTEKILVERTSQNGTFYEFSKEHIPKKSNGQNKSLMVKEILFLKSNSLNIGSPFITLASLVTILNEIYYHNQTGIRFKLHTDVIVSVENHQNLQNAYDNLISTYNNTNIIYIYLGDGDPCNNGLHGTSMSSNFVASNNFLNNPILLAHEIGHALKLSHFGMENSKYLMYGNGSVGFLDFKLLPFQVYNLSATNHVRSKHRSPSTPLLNPSNQQGMECYQALLYIESVFPNCSILLEDNISDIAVASTQFDLLSNHIDLNLCIDQVIGCENNSLQTMLDEGRSSEYKVHLEAEILKIYSHYHPVVPRRQTYDFSLPLKANLHLTAILNYIKYSHKKYRQKHLHDILDMTKARYNKIFSNKKNAEIKSRFIKH